MLQHAFDSPYIVVCGAKTVVRDVDGDCICTGTQQSCHLHSGLAAQRLRPLEEVLQVKLNDTILQHGQWHFRQAGSSLLRAQYG